MKLLRNRDHHAPGHPTRFARHVKAEPSHEGHLSLTTPGPDSVDVHNLVSSSDTDGLNIDLHPSLMGQDEYQMYDTLADPSTDVRLLQEFSTSPSWMLREAVASNPRSPGTVFDALATDEEGAVRTALLNNKSTPASALVTIAGLCDPDDRFYVDKMVCHPNWPGAGTRTPKQT